MQTMLAETRLIRQRKIEKGWRVGCKNLVIEVNKMVKGVFKANFSAPFNFKMPIFKDKTSAQ